MTDREKAHLMHIAYDNIEKVQSDTDEDLWAYEYLGNALAELDQWFEESEI